MGACSILPEGYAPRKPRSSPLYLMLDAHFETFREDYEKRFRKRYGWWRPVTDEVVGKFLQCGDPHYGFARVRCPECGAEYLRPFSCKCRGFCPSCSKRKSLDLAAFLEEDLFRPVGHRHWVWSIPRILRSRFLYHRELLPKLSWCAWQSVTTLVHEALGRDDVFPGGILVPQTFGGMANWNPHVHGLLTEVCWDREGNAYPMPDIGAEELHALEQLFSAMVFGMLLDQERVSPELVEKMRSWKHSGFSVYCDTVIDAEDSKGLKTLSEYISRAPFSLERMTFAEDSDMVLYRGEHFHSGLGRNFEVTDPLEWIARITSHIPRKGAKQVIYYGAYSQAWRGRERRQGILPKPGDDSRPGHRKVSSSSRQRWAALLKKVWDIDALKCPECGSRMKVISIIEQPSVVRRILEHLGLWEDPRPPPRPPELVCEPDADYVPWQDDVPEMEIGW